MVADMLQKTKFQNGVTLEYKCKGFKKVIFSCTKNCFLVKHMPCKASLSVAQEKNDLVRNAWKLKSTLGL